MTPIEVLNKLDLVDWSTLYICLEKSWTNRKSAIDYAVPQLESDNVDVDVCAIAMGESLDRRELRWRRYWKN